MTTEDLQGQLSRSAAVERELREKIEKLREELAEAREQNEGLRRECAVLDKASDQDAARATAAESALSEARGALREGVICLRKSAEHIQDLESSASQDDWGKIKRLRNRMREQADQLDAALARAGERGAPPPPAVADAELAEAAWHEGGRESIPAALVRVRAAEREECAKIAAMHGDGLDAEELAAAIRARAGEQETPEPRCMAVTRNGHRCDLEPHEEADDYHEAENAAEGGGTLRWSERYAPASAGEPASSGQDEEFNLNDSVLVKVTDVGRRLYDKRWRDLGMDPPALTADADGWSRFQLWDLMSEFGSALYNGCQVPFETTIRLVREATLRQPATPPPGEQGKGAPAANPPLSCGHRIGSHALKNGMLECPAQPAEQGKGGGEGWQAMVREFHAACGVPIGDSPAVRRPELRASLIEEEAKETAAALRAGDLVQTIDGLCDVIYVALGCAVECGVDLAPFFAEVHRSNMQKADGPRRADGKILKPPGWTPPDIAGLLR